jgi:hypothetical protein
MAPRHRELPQKSSNSNIPTSIFDITGIYGIQSGMLKMALNINVQSFKIISIIIYIDGTDVHSWRC